ncbi:MAG: hypothetical protein OJF49_004453 [Ktedonobacterales bacterium]|nr:MAG: hypothetical protein OJF49_004453 [Ktedonobacterales bacterium]
MYHHPSGILCPLSPSMTLGAASSHRPCFDQILTRKLDSPGSESHFRT